MYTPEHFKIKDSKEIFDFIELNSFAILISGSTGRLTATHIPVLLRRNDGEKGFLYGHIAKANPQWKNININSNIDEEVLVIFPGAHKYISPEWYEDTKINQAVPTWNYISVHAYGKIKILESKEDKTEVIKEVVKYFEGDESSYKTDDLKQSYFDSLLNGIIAFKIEITELQGKHKISQNHTEERQQSVINQLEKIGDEDSRDIAERMKNNLKEKNG